jgi:putative ABC transport system substrate-binding protein
MGACRLGVKYSILFLLVAAATLRAPVAQAAEPAQSVARIGFVSPHSPSTDPQIVATFWQSLRELGYIEGQNLIVETRWANGRYDRLPVLMTEVVGRKVDILVTYGTPAAIAAKNATSTIPILDAGMGDPVGSGLVASLARPSGNLTGLSLGWADTAGKWIELLQEMVPRLSTVAVMVNPDNPVNRDFAKELQTIAPTRGLKLRLIKVRDQATLDQAFKQARREAQAVVVVGDLTFGGRGQITALAAKHRLPAMYYLREFVDEGGLMAYGPDFTGLWRRAAEYVDKILKGAKPSDLPIEQPTKFQLVVNLKTAKTLGITILESILLRADEVIR